MGIGSKLSKLMDINGTNANELARKIDVSPQTIYSIIKRDSKKADIDVLLKLADTLGVTAEYFVDDITVSSESDLEHYSREELEHLKKYRFISTHSPDGAGVVDTVLDREYAIAEKLKEQADNIREIESRPVAIGTIVSMDMASRGRFIEYFRSVSAGTGQVIFDDVYSERIQIPDILKYRRVAYAVKVDGNSMEPLYSHGDILLIEPTCEINVNEIGIFNVSGQAYVKQLGDSKLISLNKGYKDIPLTEDSLCMGRVVDKLSDY